MIASCILLCNDVASVSPPTRVIAYSTRSQVAAAVFLAQESILDIFKSAM